MSRDIFIVAGLASKASNLVPLEMLAAQHTEIDDVHMIDDAHILDGQLVATSPTE